MNTISFCLWSGSRHLHPLNPYSDKKSTKWNLLYSSVRLASRFRRLL